MKRKQSFDEQSFVKFLKENYSKLDESWQDTDNVWGNCCNFVGFANQSKNRKLLYTRWKKNYSGLNNEIFKEKNQEEMTPEDNSIEEDVSTTSCNLKRKIEQMMVPSYAMIQCSNCSVFYIFSSITYDQCPLIDYLCSYCSLSSSDYQKRKIKCKLTVTNSNDNLCSPLRNKRERSTEKTPDIGCREENKKAMMANIDNFVNEVTVETSSSCKATVSGLPNKNYCEKAKLQNNEHVIYISDADKLKNSNYELIAGNEKYNSLESLGESNRYQFILNYSHWDQLSHCTGNDFNIRCGKIFAQYFSQFRLGCSLTFTHCNLSTDDSWKKGVKFLKLIGICKHDFCSKYIFTIDTPPSRDENIVVNISQIGQICHMTSIDGINNMNKNENTIVSVVEESRKFLPSIKYENAEISVHEGSPLSPVKYSTIFSNEDRNCEKIFDESTGSSSEYEEIVTTSQENEPSDFTGHDYSSHNQFTLDYKDWEKMMPSFDEQKLKKGWKQIFAGYFSHFNLECILEFAYCRLRKPFSMDNSVYLSTNAKCQFPNCSTFLFNITHKPIKGEIVIVDLYQQGCVSHKAEVVTTIEYNSTNNKLTNTNQDVYYTDDNIAEDQKDSLDMDVSQVVTIETSQTDSKNGIKNELASSGTESDDNAFNMENQIMPFELNSEGKIVQSFIHKFEINYEDWLKIKPLKHCKTLQPGWTDIFFQYFANLNLGCILAFSYCYANKRNFPKKGTNYLRIKSVCKYTGCCKYYFNMKKEPKVGKNGKIKAIQVGGISHRDGEVRARFIRGKYRKELAKELENTSAFDFYNQNRDRLAESGYDNTRKKSLHVLRNIKIQKKRDINSVPCSDLEGSFVTKIDDGCVRLL